MEMVKRTDILNYLITTRKFESYLEIGINNTADNFDKIACKKKIGVDPNKRSFKQPSKENELFFVGTSNEFFDGSKDKFDIIFIDGLHHEEQVHIDILNSISCLNENGVIVIHDCLPPNEKSQLRERGSTREWCGDVWKAYTRLFQSAKYEMCIVDTDFGVGILEPFKERHTASIELPDSLDYNVFVELKSKNQLNIIKVEDIFIGDMNVVYCCNNNYTPYLLYSIKTLQKTNEQHNLKIFVVQTDFTDESKSELLKMGVHVISYDKSLDIFDNYRKPKWAVNEMYIRLEIPEILKDLDRCLYLDCDTEIRGDILSFYNSDLTNKLIRGVSDFRVSGINAGVLLMNCELWREEKICDYLNEWMPNNAGKITLCDQSVINKALIGKIGYADRIYNYQKPNNLPHVIITHYATSKHFLNKAIQNSN